MQIAGDHYWCWHKGIPYTSKGVCKYPVMGDRTPIVEPPDLVPQFWSALVRAWGPGPRELIHLLCESEPHDVGMEDTTA